MISIKFSFEVEDFIKLIREAQADLKKEERPDLETIKDYFARSAADLVANPVRPFNMRHK